MLKKQVAELSKLSIENQSKNEELEQYGRCLCLRVDGIPAVSNESSDDVMNLTKSLFKGCVRYIATSLFFKSKGEHL